MNRIQTIDIQKLQEKTNKNLYLFIEKDKWAIIDADSEEEASKIYRYPRKMKTLDESTKYTNSIKLEDLNIPESEPFEVKDISAIFNGKYKKSRKMKISITSIKTKRQIQIMNFHPTVFWKKCYECKKKKKYLTQVVRIVDGKETTDYMCIDCSSKGVWIA